MREALEAAKQFIENGIEMGFITMPDASTPDPAHDTLPLIRAALNPLASDNWMTISVDEAGQTIGIDHPTKADWLDVYRAMVAVRDHINDRIAKQEGCPVRPAALTPSALSGDAGEGE